MSPPPTTVELIVYLTPQGPLAEQCRWYWDAMATHGGPTRAQDYPPHVTVVGFFRREHHHLDAVIAHLGAAVDECRSVRPPEIAVMARHTWPGWVGLELASTWVVDLAERFALLNRPRSPHEDEVRVKRWLHLSLAYGVDDLSGAASMACELVDPDAPAGWHLLLYERSEGHEWVSHQEWSLVG